MAFCLLCKVGIRRVDMNFSTFSDITKKYPNERVQVFIDSPNFYRAVYQEIPDCDLDYHRLSFKLVGQRKVIRINYYVSELDPEWDSDGAQKQQRFFATIRRLPFLTVKTRPLRYSPDKKERWEKGIDILIATDMLSQAYVNGYDSMILVSGDGDFAPVLDEIKKMGKNVEVAFLVKSISQALIESCDIFVELDHKTLEDCTMRKKKAASS